MNKMERIESVLMNRDGLTWEEANELVADARAELHYLLESDEWVDEAEFCYDWFGLEPDYIYQLLR